MAALQLNGLIYPVPESTESFIEDQGSRGACFGPPLPPPLPSANSLSFLVFLCVAVKVYKPEKGGLGIGGGVKSYDGENAWSSIIH